MFSKYESNLVPVSWLAVGRRGPLPLMDWSQSIFKDRLLGLIVRHVRDRRYSKMHSKTCSGRRYVKRIPIFINWVGCQIDNFYVQWVFCLVVKMRYANFDIHSIWIRYNLHGRGTVPAQWWIFRTKLQPTTKWWIDSREYCHVLNSNSGLIGKGHPWT